MSFEILLVCCSLEVLGSGFGYESVCFPIARFGLLVSILHLPFIQSQEVASIIISAIASIMLYLATLNFLTLVHFPDYFNRTENLQIYYPVQIGLGLFGDCVFAWAVFQRRGSSRLVWLPILMAICFDSLQIVVLSLYHNDGTGSVLHWARLNSVIALSTGILRSWWASIEDNQALTRRGKSVERNRR